MFEESMGSEIVDAIDMESFLQAQRQQQDFQYRYDLLKSGLWESSGGQIRIPDMSEAHIRNVIRMLRRYAENPYYDGQEVFAKLAIPVFEAALAVNVGGGAEVEAICRKHEF